MSPKRQYTFLSHGDVGGSGSGVEYIWDVDEVGEVIVERKLLNSTVTKGGAGRSLYMHSRLVQ